MSKAAAVAAAMAAGTRAKWQAVILRHAVLAALQGLAISSRHVQPNLLGGLGHLLFL